MRNEEDFTWNDDTDIYSNKQFYLNLNSEMRKSVHVLIFDYCENYTRKLNPEYCSDHYLRVFKEFMK